MRAIRGQLEVIQEIVFEIVIYQMEVSELLTSCTTQTPQALKASEIKESNAISYLTDDNTILYPLLPSDTLDQ